MLEVLTFISRGSNIEAFAFVCDIHVNKRRARGLKYAVKITSGRKCNICAYVKEYFTDSQEIHAFLKRTTVCIILFEKGR